MGRADHAGIDRGFEFKTLSGPCVLDDLGSDLDELLASVDAPITARRTWLGAWVRAFTEHDPWVVTVRSGGRLDGAALLARRRRAGHTEIVAIGHGVSDALRIPLRDAPTAPALACALGEALETIRGPWRLIIEQLPIDDPASPRLETALGHAERSSGVGSPMLRCSPGDTLEDHASTRYLREARRRRRSLEKEHGAVEIAFVRDADGVGELLPQLAAVRHRRDAQVPRGTEFERRSFRAFLDDALVAHAQQHELEIAVLRVDGACAAYAVCLLDGDTCRQWQTSFDPAWSKYSPGTLITNATVERVLGEARFTEYDFMRGVYDWKTALATDVVPAVVLKAWSSAPLRSLERVLRALRARLRPTAPR